MSVQRNGFRPARIRILELGSRGILSRSRRRGERGISLMIAMLLIMFAMTTALVLAQMVVNPRLTAEYAVHRSAAFAAACAGLKQSKLIAGHSTIFTDPNHAAVAFNGTLHNAAYAGSMVYAGGMNVTITSTGTSGSSTCVLTRNCLAAPDNSKLRVINYITSDTIKFQYDITSAQQRTPLEEPGPIEIPNWTYWQNLAQAYSPTHYFSGDQTWGPHATLNGVYYVQGNLIVKNTQVTPPAWVVLVATGNVELQGPDNLASDSWADPVIVAGGNINEKSGVNVLQGAIWCAGTVNSDFLIQNGGVTGRIEAGDFTQSNGTLTDGWNAATQTFPLGSPYVFLNGFSYNPAAAGWLLTYTGWAETWQ